MNPTEKVRKAASQLPEGKPVPSRAFLGLGSRVSVDQALSRLVREGILSRPARGVYMRPKRNPHVGVVPPRPIEVARSIASEFGFKVEVHGAEAVRQLGLSNQVPTRLIYLTDGPSRTFHLGALEVTLKHASPRKLALAGRPAGIALIALWYLGKEKVTVNTIAQLYKQLGPEEFKVLCNARPHMAEWMQEVFRVYREARTNG